MTTAVKLTPANVRLFDADVLPETARAQAEVCIVAIYGADGRFAGLFPDYFTVTKAQRFVRTFNRSPLEPGQTAEYFYREAWVAVPATKGGEV